MVLACNAHTVRAPRAPPSLRKAPSRLLYCCVPGDNRQEHVVYLLLCRVGPQLYNSSSLFHNGQSRWTDNTHASEMREVFGVQITIYDTYLVCMFTVCIYALGIYP